MESPSHTRLLGCRLPGPGLEDEAHGQQFLPHLTQAPSTSVLHPQNGAKPYCQAVVLGQNPLPILPSLCPSSSSLELSPPKIGSSESHPSLSPGLCTHTRMAQMTSSLQRQEVRIQAFFFFFLFFFAFSRPLLWLCSSPPVWLQATSWRASNDPYLSGRCPSWSCLCFPGWGGRGPCFLFDCEKTASERESDLAKATQLGRRGWAGVAQITPTFPGAKALFSLTGTVPRET